jgi:hypothetical protein
MQANETIRIIEEEDDIEAFTLGAFDEEKLSFDKGVVYSPYEDNDDYN